MASCVDDCQTYVSVGTKCVSEENMIFFCSCPPLFLSKDDLGRPSCVPVQAQYTVYCICLFISTAILGDSFRALISWIRTVKWAKLTSKLSDESCYRWKGIMYICYLLSSLLSTAVWAILLANLKFNFTDLFPVFNSSLFFFMSGTWIQVALMMKTFPTFHKNSIAGILQKVLTDSRYMLAMQLVLAIFFCIPLIVI